VRSSGFTCSARFSRRAWSLPGSFGQYFAYSDSARSGGHPVIGVTDYALWFWWPRAGAWAAAAILGLAAAGTAWRLPAGRLRRFCLALLAVNAADPALHRPRRPG
jgi:hypothetical protein